MKTFVVTGASSCGKTTIIKKLGELGCLVLHEVARDLIAEGQLLPRTTAFQEELAKRHLDRETHLASSGMELAFLDRGIYDVGAFSRHFGDPVPQAVATSGKNYDAVFFLESLDQFHNDGIRIESDMSEALNIRDLIRNEYETRGIKCIDVPKMGIDERASFILRHAQSTIASQDTTAV